MKKAKPHKWTTEQIDFVKSNLKGTPYKTIREMVNKQFGLSLTLEQVGGFLKRNGLTNGRDTTFEGGKPPWNKGKKGLHFEGSEKGWFTKGQKPKNYRPVGSERICSKDGYILVKVKDDGKYQDRWRLKHLVVWEKAYGKVPENHAIIFLDSDRGNVTLENLKMITRTDLATMNKYNLFSSDPEVTKTGLKLARLNQEISSLELHGGDKEKFKKHLLKAKSLGIQEQTFLARLRRGWSIKDAANKPLHYKPRRKLNA